MYLAVVMDALSRLIVGLAMYTHMRAELVLAALVMALQQRRPSNVIHHSDHGCQYTSIAFGLRCKAAGVRPSMGTVGDAYDNAMCESFFATLECELIDRYSFKNSFQAKVRVFRSSRAGTTPRDATRRSITSHPSNSKGGSPHAIHSL